MHMSFFNANLHSATFAMLLTSDGIIRDCVVVKSHENNVDQDAESDKDFSEGIKHDESENFADFDPYVCTVPDAKNIAPVRNLLLNYSFHPALLFIIVIIVTKTVVSIT